MGYNKISVTGDEWTLIGENLSAISVYNIGQHIAFVNFSANTTPPDDTVGMPIDVYMGFSKRNLADMTFAPSPSYVWAKSGGSGTTLVVETN